MIIMCALTSCTDNRQAKDGQTHSSIHAAPGTRTETLEISPKNPVRDSTLTAMPTGFQFSGAVAVTWLVNGAPLDSATGAQLRAPHLAKGDTVQARAVVNGNEIISEPVTIINTPPVITKQEIVLDALPTGVSLRVDASGQDPDGDQVTFVYEWKKNDEPVGKESKIEGVLKRGDVAAVWVTPFDGTDYGTTVMMRREIANLPPVITQHNEYTFDGSVYTYQVKASDPDGDALEYSLESPAEGMTINSSTGFLKWNVPAHFKGKKNVSIVVRDGHGGTASYTTEITIQE